MQNSRGRACLRLKEMSLIFALLYYRNLERVVCRYVFFGNQHNSHYLTSSMLQRIDGFLLLGSLIMNDYKNMLQVIDSMFLNRIILTILCASSKNVLNSSSILCVNSKLSIILLLYISCWHCKDYQQKQEWLQMNNDSQWFFSLSEDFPITQDILIRIKII